MKKFLTFTLFFILAVFANIYFVDEYGTTFLTAIKCNSKQNICILTECGKVTKTTKLDANKIIQVHKFKKNIYYTGRSIVSLIDTLAWTHCILYNNGEGLRGYSGMASAQRIIVPRKIYNAAKKFKAKNKDISAIAIHAHFIIIVLAYILALSILFS